MLRPQHHRHRLRYGTVSAHGRLKTRQWYTLSLEQPWLSRELASFIISQNRGKPTKTPPLWQKNERAKKKDDERKRRQKEEKVQVPVTMIWHPVCPSAQFEFSLLIIFEAAAVPAPKAATVEAEDELPQIDETTVENLSQEVVLPLTTVMCLC